MTNRQMSNGGAKRLVTRICMWAVVLASVWWAGGCAAPRQAPAVVAGLQYEHQQVPSEPWSIHVLRIDRRGSDYRFETTLSDDRIFGLMPLSRQVEALYRSGERVLAGVNGDFFVIKPGPYQGDPQGLHVVRGELVSAPIGTSFWLDTQGRPHIGEVLSAFKAAWPDGKRYSFGVNQARGDGAVVLYTPRLGASTRTAGGVEYVLERAGDGPWLPLEAGRTYAARVAEVRRQGDTTLADGVMVLSVGPGLAKDAAELPVGSEVELSLDTRPDLTGVRTAVGGGPVLIEGGQLRQWKPPQPRHPRTAIGFNDGAFFLVVVDGRQPGLSVGMTFAELAELMQRLGCTEAMNLDGGGSSTFWLDGRVLNSPSDGRERSVSNGLVLVGTGERTGED